MSTMKKTSILVLAIASFLLGWFWLSSENDYCAMQYTFFGKAESGDANVYGKGNRLLIQVLDTNSDGTIDQELWGYPQLADGGNYVLRDHDFDGVYDEVIVMEFVPTYIDVRIPVPSTPPLICKAHNQALKKDADNSSAS
ncbi:hypothetical protein [Pleionea sediminis]|uniref:hypothetical protein n=1 Tax=Pleionea sediminis TaxID=2569479 RepID=UPI0011869107|nr:hypothetical protein [Pleionea sediminis]